MQPWVVLIALAAPGGLAEESAAPPQSSATSFYEQAAEELTPRLRTGSLLFNQGDCLAVRIYTASPYTHVACVVMDEGRPIVYDSMNGAGVRRQTLAQYLLAQSPDELHVFHPRRDLSEEQGRQLQQYLESQLGRPYAVKHHLTGRRCEGLHCAEYVTDALMAIGLLHAEQPARVSPASLVEGITAGEVYLAEGSVDLTRPIPPAPTAANRCQRLWLGTKQCLATCCDRLSGWILCR